MAGNVGEVISPAELVERLDVAEMEAMFGARLDAELPAVVREAADMLAPGVWDQMAPPAQQILIAIGGLLGAAVGVLQGMLVLVAG